MTTELKRAIAITPSPCTATNQAPGPRLFRTSIKRKAHVAVAAIIAMSIPTATALAMALWLSQNQWALTETLAKTIVLVIWAGFLAATVAKCDMKYLFRGAGSALLTFLLPSALAGAVVLVSLAGLVGLAIAHMTYTSLRPGDSEAGAASADELNPRCKSCHARSLCPLQPGGFADKYTPLDAPISQKGQHE